jgi:hypothetical protein
MLNLNLGGEGELVGMVNQQAPWVLAPNWARSRDGKSFADVVADGHAFLICPNDKLALPDETVDTVYTNSVPIDVTTWLGPGVQSSEIKRILKSGGHWFRDGVLYYTKP